MKHKGYTLLELLIVLMIISSLSLLSISKYSDLNLDYLYFINDYLNNQANALCSNQTVSYKRGISFNSKGHVNMARTINFARHDVVIHLGSGYLTYE